MPIHMARAPVGAAVWWWVLGLAAVVALVWWWSTTAARTRARVPADRRPPETAPERDKTDER